MSADPAMIAASPNDASPWASGRRLTLLYIFALSTVAVLSIGAQWLIQWQLNTGESDSRVINLAGRQRMLSQRLAKTALQLRNVDPAVQQGVRTELADTLRQWSQNHDGLQRGSKTLGLPGDNSDAVSTLFTVIEPDFRAIEFAAKRLANAATNAPLDERAIATIQRHEGDFLAGMDAIVSQYVVEAEQRVTRLGRLESGILVLTLLVLLAEGLLIFRPAVRRIEQAVARLETVSGRLRKAKDEAEHGNAAKTRFLANVSHELRTPMTAVLGMTELARESTDEEERDGYLKVVEEAGESLLSLLNDLIDTARIDAGQLDLVVTPFNPQEVVERVARMMRFACQEKDLTLAIDKPPQRLPSVKGDARRLEQILLNLLGNAIKWTEAGSVTAGCEALELTSESVKLRFWVRDTGIGISPVDQQRIFEPFTQLRGARRLARGGAGLGLAICRRIADAMNATLELKSTPGVGTTVFLTGNFPIASAADAAHVDAEPSTLSEAISVLVVEDTEVNQLLIRRLLQREGHRVDVVGSGEEAVALYQEARFDLVLVDLQLPGIDGETTASQLNEIDIGLGRPAPPMICITAHAGPAAASVEERFDAIVTKPIKRDSLMRTLVKVVRQRDSENASDPQTTPGSETMNNTAFDHELAAAFLSVAGQQLQQLRDAIDQRSLFDTRVLAHRFRGQLGYFAFDDLTKALDTLETACEANDLATVSRTGPTVAERLAAAMNQLAGQLAEAETPASATTVA